MYGNKYGKEKCPGLKEAKRVDKALNEDVKRVLKKRSC